MRFIKLPFLFFLTIVFFAKANATEIIGGSIRYEALGNQKYKIIGIVNRNCGDSALGIPTFKIYSGTTTYNLSVTRTSIKDITPHCSTVTPPCNPSNTKTTQGQEQHTFEATLDFSTSPYNAFYNTGKCNVFFSMEACCRSSKTANMTANNFYIEAMLNLCVLGNSKMNTSPSGLPNSYLQMCNNSPIAYISGTNDFIDGDSLYFSMTTPKKSKDSSERFIDPFSLRYPLRTYFFKSKPIPNAKPPRGLYFDSLTGDIILTPIDTSLGAIVNVRIDEFRKINNTMTLVGFSTKEIFIKIQNCPDNNAPTIIAPNNWDVCEGNKICFPIFSQDSKTLSQTINDTTTITWNNGIPAATFTIDDTTAREKSAEFCWQTKIGDTKTIPYKFIVTARDNYCNPPLQTTKIFYITVRPHAQSVRKYEQPFCGKLIFMSYPKDTINYKGTYTYEWTIRDSSNTGLPYYHNFKQRDSFIFTKTGNYTITHNINNPPISCPTSYTDTVMIPCIGGSNINSVVPNKLSVYPNPTNGTITIDLNKNLHWIEMKLTNAVGQVVYTGPVTSDFDMGKYAKGFYTLELMSKEGKYVASIIKE